MTGVRPWQVVRIDTDETVTVVMTCRSRGIAERRALLLDVFALVLRISGGPRYSYDIRQRPQPVPTPSPDRWRDR